LIFCWGCGKHLSVQRADQNVSPVVLNRLVFCLIGGEICQKQNLTFTVIMVLIFVYVMTFYNAGMENGVTFSTFGYALKNMWVEVIGAFIAQRYIASKIVKKLVARIFDENDKPVFKLLATAGFTVSLMAPIMTFYVSFYHFGFSSE